MLSNARSAESRSFLRELDFSLILVENNKAREYFLKKLKEVNHKRNEQNIIKTGEKDTKSELLAYLHQKGYTQTANVWARALSMDRSDINSLLKILQQRLLEENCEGVLEIHLQDREINSPHIQYVGINALKAEMIIAETLVKLKYENNIESALSKKDFRPYFKINAKARFPKHSDLQDNIKYYETKKKAKITDAEIDKLINEFNEILSRQKMKLKQIEQKTIKQSDFELKLQALRANNMQSLTKLKEQRRSYRLRRLRRRIRRK